MLYLDFVSAEFRYNVRGPQGPPRIATPPPTHQFKKKWHVAQPPPPPLRMGVRKRPVPIHNMNFKPNIKNQPPKRQITGMQFALQQTIIPSRNVWKNNNLPFKKPDKFFLSSPTVKTPEYEYHIQTNNIPTHASIKQTDYKGPIHTIPAPKLSPADKPKNMETIQSIEHENTVQIQKAHQYQVTEPVDTATRLNQKNKYYLPEDPSNVQDANAVSKVIAPMSSQELFKLFNTYNQQQQQQQQPMLDSTYALPLTQQPQLQNPLFTQTTAPYQSLMAQQGLFQPEGGYVNQIPQSQKFKPPFQPEYQTFNYEEPPNLKQQDQPVVPSPDFPEMNAEQKKNPVEALAQTQYVQRFFDTRTDEVNNNVEPDARPALQNFDVDSNNENTDNYYTIVPSQQTIEALVSLQEAGKRNSKNRNDSVTAQSQNIQISPSVPMTIYVPDEYEETGETINLNHNQDHISNIGEESKNDFVEKDVDDTIRTENARSKNRLAFGSRSKPKKN